MRLVGAGMLEAGSMPKMAAWSAVYTPLPEPASLLAPVSKLLNKK